MKKIMLSLIIIAGLFLLACGGADGENNRGNTIVSPFQKTYSGLLNAYIELKDALVAADKVLADKKIEDLRSALSSLENISGSDVVNAWKGNLDTLKMALTEATSAGDVEAQRKAFSPMSESLISMTQKVAPPGEELYVQNCPMAFDFEGANWLSNSKEVVNPYFGDKMLNCGSVTATIEKAKE